MVTISMGNKPLPASDHESLPVSSTDHNNKSLPASDQNKSLPASDHNKPLPTSKSLPACFVADQPAYCLMLNSLGEPYSEAAHGPDPLGKGFAYRAPVEWVVVGK